MIRRAAYAALLAAMTSGILAGGAVSRDLTGVRTSSQDRPAYRYDHDAVRGWHGQHFTVMPLSYLDQYDPFTSIIFEMAADRRRVQSLQAALRSNPALEAQLRARNVELNNVVVARRALDGSITFYLR